MGELKSLIWCSVRHNLQRRKEQKERIVLACEMLIFLSSIQWSVSTMLGASKLALALIVPCKPGLDT